MTLGDYRPEIERCGCLRCVRRREASDAGEVARRLRRESRYALVRVTPGEPERLRALASSYARFAREGRAVNDREVSCRGFHEIEYALRSKRRTRR